MYTRKESRGDGYRIPVSRTHTSVHVGRKQLTRGRKPRPYSANSHKFTIFNIKIVIHGEFTLYSTKSRRPSAGVPRSGFMVDPRNRKRTVNFSRFEVSPSFGTSQNRSYPIALIECTVDVTRKQSCSTP